jgi:hypothetical protein
LWRYVSLQLLDLLDYAGRAGTRGHQGSEYLSCWLAGFEGRQGFIHTNNTGPFQSQPYWAIPLQVGQLILQQA